MLCFLMRLSSTRVMLKKLPLAPFMVHSASTHFCRATSAYTMGILDCATAKRNVQGCHEGTSHQAHGQDTHSEQRCTQHNAPDTGDAKHTPTLSLAAEKVPSLSRPTHTRITLWR